MNQRLFRPSHLLVLLIWLAVVIAISAKHEIGKDEARALILAIEAPSYQQLPMAINNEGHPVLWYVLLRFAHSVYPHPVVLKILNIILAFGAVLLFFRYSPFALWQRILFIFGVFPLYEFGVICRNYAISMLFFFAFAALYPYRKQKSLLLALMLALLANTNAFACIFALLLAAYWLLDEVLLERRTLRFFGTAWLIIAMGLVAVGIAYSIAVSLPPRDTVLTHYFGVNVGLAARTFLVNLVNPGPHFKSAFPLLSDPVRDLLFYGLIFGLLIRPLAAGTLWMGTALMGTFLTLVYGGHARHQGMFIIFMMTLYWIVYQQVSSKDPGLSARVNLAGLRKAVFANWAKPGDFRSRWMGKLAAFHLSAVYGILTGIFVLHIAMAAYRVRADVVGVMSSNQAFAEYLAAHPEYDGAIIIGEPDYNLVSLLYYADRQFYIVREHRFGHVTKWTAASKVALSLGELLDAAQRVQRQEQRDVLIAIGHEGFSRQDSLFIDYSYNRLFTASPQEMAGFRAKTAKIAEFTRATTDENWEVFLLR